MCSARDFEELVLCFFSSLSQHYSCDLWCIICSFWQNKPSVSLLLLHSHHIILSWRSCWGCCRSSRRRSPPPPSRSARSAPRCSGTQTHAGSPSSAGAMTNVPMATTQTNTIVMLISAAGGQKKKSSILGSFALFLHFGALPWTDGRNMKIPTLF